MIKPSGWIQADLNCLLCARRLGYLLGTATSFAARQFLAFKPINSAEPPLRLRGNEQFRCPECGGMGVVDEVEQLVTRTATAESRPARSRPSWRDRRFRRTAPAARLSA